MVDSGEIAMSTPLRQWKSFVQTRPWLVVSEVGKSYLEEVGKHAIMRRTRVSARDLRILDPKLSYTATILGREKAIVVNLESIRAIITATEMLILNPMDPCVSPFVRDLELKLSSFDGSKAIAVEKCDKAVKGEAGDGSLGNLMNTSKMGSSKLQLPFEFRVLEICLTFVCEGLEFETSTLEQETYTALDEISIKINMFNLQRVRQIKSRLLALFGRVQKVRDELEHVLNDDMDMAEMYLTDKLVSGQVEESKPVDEIENNANTQDDDMDNKSSMAIMNTQKPKIGALEMLLEAYFVQMEGALSRLSNMREYVDDTEDYINIILDDKQNQLLHIGVILGTTLLVMHLGMATIDSFNMKLHISVYDTGQRQFNEATAGIVGGCLCLLFLALLLLKTKGLLG